MKVGAAEQLHYAMIVKYDWADYSILLRNEGKNTCYEKTSDLYD